MNKLIQRLIFWPLALLPLAACQNDLPEPPASGPASAEETITVPVTLTVGGGTPIVRDLPPGMEQGLIPDKLCDVDRVRLIIFRREETLESEETAPFVYHQEDNQVVNNQQTFNEIVLEWDQTSKKDNGNVFDYKLTKKKGYQYKIIALGYNEAYSSISNYYQVGRNEKTLFNLNLQDGVTTPQTLALTLDTENQQGEDFFNNLGKPEMERPFGKKGGETSDQTSPYYCLTEGDGKHKFLSNDNNENDPLSLVAAPAPEIFYAICTNENGEEIISYNDINAISGHLYRGVAKVTVEITDDQSDTYKRYWVALLANNVNTHTLLSSYEDFHDADQPVEKRGDVGEWTLLGVNSCSGDGKTAKITTFVLPTITELAIRLFSTGPAGQVLYYNNYRLYTNAYSEADNATGIITSVTDGEQFYFRRNKSYRITGRLSDIEVSDELPQ